MEPFLKNSVRLFVLKDNEFSFNKFEDLIGKKGVKPIGAKYGEEFENYVVEHDIKVAEVGDKVNGFKMLESKRVDFVISDIFDGQNYLRGVGLQDTMVPLEKEVMSTDVLYLVSRNSPLADLVPQLEEALRQMRSEGLLETFEMRYR